MYQRPVAQNTKHCLWQELTCPHMHIHTHTHTQKLKLPTLKIFFCEIFACLGNCKITFFHVFLMHLPLRVVYLRTLSYRTVSHNIPQQSYTKYNCCPFHYTYVFIFNPIQHHRKRYPQSHALPLHSLFFTITAETSHLTQGTNGEPQFPKQAIKCTLFSWVELIKSQDVQFATPQRIILCFSSSK